MSEIKSSLATLVIGLLLGFVGGLFIAAATRPTSDQLWSLAGSAGGAIVAIASGIWLFHYQSNETEKGERRRIRDLIDGALAHVKVFYDAEGESFKRYSDMSNAMRDAVAEYRIAHEAARKHQHESGEIARAAKHFRPAIADQVEMVGVSSELSSPGFAKNAVEELEHSLLEARRALRV